MVTTLNLTPAISEEASQWTQRQMNLSIAGVEVPVTHSLTVCDIDDLLTRYESTSDPAPIVVDLKLQTNQWHMATAGGFRCLVATVAGEQLAQLFQQHRYAMFKYNPRGPLGSVRVNKEVVSTLEDTIEREMFLLLNNGLSGLCESFTPPSEMGGTIHTHVRDFQIVNGCQTTYNIWNHWRRGKSLEGVSVSLKLVEGLCIT